MSGERMNNEEGGPDTAGKPTILIVDDNENDRLLLRYYLNFFQCRILEADNGAEGLAVAVRERPILIVSDALMPEMDGFQFLREVRRTPGINQVPFVFYSAVYTGDRDEELALSLGADAFIAKPKDPEEFVRILNNILASAERRRPEPSASLLENDELYLRSYSRVIATRLEEKVRELSASESKFRNFFHNIRDVVIVVDGQRVILDANEPALVKVFGYSLEEILGKSSRMLFADEATYRKTGNHYTPGAESQAPGLLETVYRRKNGESFHAEVSGNILRDEAGKDMGYISVIRDITERKALEEQLHHAQKMEAIGTLAGGIAHDFNNIITAIIGFSTLVQMKMQPEDPSRENLREIISAGERAAALTRGLLSYSRKDAMRMDGLDLNEVVQQSLKLLKRVIGEDVILDVTQAGEPLFILGDSGQLEQLLMNLATNARDAMPCGGTLFIETKRITLDEDFQSRRGFGKTGDSYALLTVEDTGQGMDEATRQRIFDPFFTTKESGKGTGLGLSIVYGIVKQHNGYVDVSSEPGKGAVFNIYLPLTSAKVVKTDRPSMASMRGGDEVVLVVEDNEVIRNLFTAILGEFGYQAHPAADGMQAVGIVKELKGRIDLAIIDIIMPGKNGRQVLDDLLAISPELKHIFMSGYPRDVISGKALIDDSEGYLHKPVSPYTLLERVRDILDGKQ